ncbi:hypothetical protein FHS31_001917 [Sphingomonas vulcanisoli]|uniref:EF-hand domain-containing protein n=1 Tax=Sphingomonas vulcanisoli TaxID=1658060 RepID=A0ABX0TV16_9SPHN|nr:EF-hand domain-containing protein [Sphingomonas vulcanisoli]NIJ08300.1 hypothetical protein [Sphingomonas vulcanisoli]
MWRYLIGAVAGLLVAGGVMLLWKTPSGTHSPFAQLAAAATNVQSDDALPDPPTASEKTREEKRFSRYDHDKDGKVSRDEFLAARHKAFTKLDVNGDGKLSFDEYAVKTEDRFADADKDKSGALDAAEFATTKIQRKSKPKVNCTPAEKPKDEDES